MPKFHNFGSSGAQAFVHKCMPKFLPFLRFSFLNTAGGGRAKIGMQFFGAEFFIIFFHGLLENDPDRHLQFCEVILNKDRQSGGIIQRITWSDEVSRKLSGAVKSHNCDYYSTESPI